ncbi:MAG: squalene/oxidosqualene cyclase [Phycisphaerales bacterium]|nr:squalene/oxidosqualene cyclase [Phycisphaerales bacterium]
MRPISSFPWLTALIVVVTVAARSGATAVVDPAPRSPASPAATQPSAHPISADPITRPTREQIDEAANKAIAYLSAHQLNGIWDPPAPDGTPQSLAVTSLVFQSVLGSFQNRDDKLLSASLALLDSSKPSDTFTAGTRVVIAASPAFGRRDKYRFQTDEFVDAALRMNAGDAGLFGPVLTDRNSDRISSYYGVAGLLGCEQVGREIPAKFWSRAETALRKSQAAEGTWSRHPGEAAGSDVDFRTVAAAYLSLHIAADHRDPKASAECSGNFIDKGADLAMAWLDAHAAEAISAITSGKLSDPCESAVWVKRVGEASAARRLGGRVWLAEIGSWLLQAQREDGSWGGSVTETAYALQFLSRCKIPVAFNKLAYPPGANGAAWNQRPHDMFNMADRVGFNLCSMPVAYQIVTADSATEDICSAPILFISGNAPIEFTDAQVSRLRTYVERGGLIVGNADCGSAQFSTGFTALGAKLLPNYQFAELSANSAIFTDEQYTALRWKRKQRVVGLSNGVRQLMLLIPEADPSRAWETRATQARPEAFELINNIYVYSIGKKGIREGTPKIDPLGEPDGRSPSGVKPIRIARIEIGDNWNPEPAAWPRLAAILRAEHHADLKVESIKPGAGGFTGFHIAHLTGTTHFQFTEEQRKELREFVGHGGTVVIDAAGGSADFADGAAIELKTIFGEKAAAELERPIPIDHALYSGWKLESRLFRSFARRKLDGETKSPRIRGITVGDRIAVFFSREDLTAGLAGTTSDGILGYEPDAATKLMEQIIHYCAR